MPKQKITQEIILEAAFSLAREEGFASVNARSIAKRIGCSVQPIYSYLGNMGELMSSLYEFAYQYYNRYVETNADKQQYFESMGVCHISFAEEEKNLFHFLFLSPYMHAGSIIDVYKKYGRPDVVQSIQDTLDLAKPEAEQLYMDMIIYTHGIACLIATEAANITFEEVEPKISFAFSSFLLQLRRRRYEINYS